MPEEEDWIYTALMVTEVLWRNVLAMYMANKQGNYASRTEYVELFINGDYEGIYVLMEKIKRGPDRVDIAKLNPNEITGDDITGGYIFKTDWEPVDWRSKASVCFLIQRGFPTPTPTLSGRILSGSKNNTFKNTWTIGNIPCRIQAYPSTVNIGTNTWI